MNIIDQVKQTSTYKALDSVQRIVLSKKQGITEIRLGINMSNLVGFDKWVQTSNPRSHIKSVVQEIINNSI